MNYFNHKNIARRVNDFALLQNNGLALRELLTIMASGWIEMFRDGKIFHAPEYEEFVGCSIVLTCIFEEE